jgi:hypothetical protein
LGKLHSVLFVLKVRDSMEFSGFSKGTGKLRQREMEK